MKRIAYTKGQSRHRRGVASSLEAVLIAGIIVPASWVFYLFVTFWCKVIFNVIAPLVQWPYL